MLKRSAEVLAVGLASYDISLFVDGFPGENSKWETGAMIENGGGPAANAAYLLSLWGARCAFAGLLGDDLYGQRMVEEFKLAGIDLSLTEMRKRHTTPVSVILVNNQNGSRTIVNRKAAGNALQLNPAQFSHMNPRLLLFDGHELEASCAVLDAFPDSATMLDAGSLRPGTADLAGKVEYLVASERFALQVSGFAGLDSEAAQRECLDKLRAKARADAKIVVTLGSRGLIFDERGTFHSLPASAASTVDSTGAGDFFHGAFAYGVLRNLSFVDTLRMATTAAGLSVQIRGGRPSIPALATVQQELKKC
jgi:sulfofructose kinase